MRLIDYQVILLLLLILFVFLNFIITNVLIIFIFIVTSSTIVLKLPSLLLVGVHILRYYTVSGVR